MAEQIEGKTAENVQTETQYTGCQEILPNKTQCPNIPYAFVGELPYCRLHLAFLLNDPTIDRSFITVADAINQPDLDMMIKTTPVSE